VIRSLSTCQFYVISIITNTTPISRVIFRVFFPCSFIYTMMIYDILGSLMNSYTWLRKIVTAECRSYIFKKIKCILWLRTVLNQLHEISTGDIGTSFNTIVLIYWFLVSRPKCNVVMIQKYRRYTETGVVLMVRLSSYTRSGVDRFPLFVIKKLEDRLSFPDHRLTTQMSPRDRARDIRIIRHQQLQIHEARICFDNSAR